MPETAPDKKIVEQLTAQEQASQLKRQRLEARKKVPNTQSPINAGQSPLINNFPIPQQPASNESPATTDQSRTLSLLRRLAQTRQNKNQSAEGAVLSGKLDANIAAQISSKQILNGLWASVWLDWTTLSLWGLNLYLAASLLMPDRLAQFGDDDIIGTWLGGGRLNFNRDFAKIIEILIIIILDILVITLLTVLFIILYQVSVHPWETVWKWLTGQSII